MKKYHYSRGESFNPKNQQSVLIDGYFDGVCHVCNQFRASGPFKFYCISKKSLLSTQEVAEVKTSGCPYYLAAASPFPKPDTGRNPAHTIFTQPPFPTMSKPPSGKKTSSYERKRIMTEHGELLRQSQVQVDIEAWKFFDDGCTVATTQKRLGCSMTRVKGSYDRWKKHTLKLEPLTITKIEPTTPTTTTKEEKEKPDSKPATTTPKHPLVPVDNEELEPILLKILDNQIPRKVKKNLWKKASQVFLNRFGLPPKKEKIPGGRLGYFLADVLAWVKPAFERGFTPSDVENLSGINYTVLYPAWRSWIGEAITYKTKNKRGEIKEKTKTVSTTVAGAETPSPSCGRNGEIIPKVNSYLSSITRIRRELVDYLESITPEEYSKMKVADRDRLVVIYQHTTNILSPKNKARTI